MAFFDDIEARSQAAGTLLCVGLDPHLAALAEPTAGAALDECLRIIEATADLALAFKVNAAFFEALGPAGIEAMIRVFEAIPPEVPAILDAKRGDIASTAQAYAEAAFEVAGAGAVTLSPWMGEDAVSPFLAFADRGVFILARTSNESAAAVQELSVVGPGGRRRLYEAVAREARRWGDVSRLGFVVGATQPEALAAVRALDPRGRILAPGVGFQGGDLGAALAAGLRADGGGMLIAVSRAIAQAPDPREAARTLRDHIQEARRLVKTGAKRATAAPIPPALAPLADALLTSGCVRFGEFTLKSGLRSPIYIDLRRLAANPGLLARIAEALLPLLGELRFDHLAPLPYAALPIGTAVALAGDYSMVYPRKEAKAYGTRATVEGIFTAGEAVVILDDLATTGSSKFEAVERLAEAGLTATDVVVLIDRQSGAREALAEQGLSLRALFTLGDLVDHWAAAGLIAPPQAEEVRAFLAGGSAG